MHTLHLVGFNVLLGTLSPVHTKSTVAETGDKSATKSTAAGTVDFVADTVNFVADTEDFVAGFGDKSATTWIRQLVEVNFVADTVDFLADMVDFVYGALYDILGMIL